MKDSKTLWVYGDSWAWGWAGGIDDSSLPEQYENRYTKLFCDYLGIRNMEDKSHYGLSFGQITERFLKDSPSFNKNDIVFVTIPPDSRGYFAKGDCLNSILYGDAKYEKLLELNEYNLYHFIFHTNLFITAISDVCSRLNVECVMQHNYGSLELLDWCRKDTILDINNSMWNWLNLPLNYDLKTFKNTDGIRVDETYRNNSFDKYLIKRNHQYDLHPNQMGHNVIFNNIKRKYKIKNNDLI